MKAIFDPKDRYGSAGWGSESARSFMGQRPESRTTPFRPSPRPNLLGGSDAPVDFTSSMRVAHTDPGLSPRTVRSVRSNDPSEADHPLLGLMDPHRKARLAGSFGSSYYQDAFLSPRREDYVPPRSKPPFADKAHEAFVFDRTPRHTSEQRSSFSASRARTSPDRLPRPIICAPCWLSQSSADLSADCTSHIGTTPPDDRRVPLFLQCGPCTSHRRQSNAPCLTRL